MERQEFIATLKWMQQNNIITYIQYNDMLLKGLPYTKKPKRRTLQK